MTNRIMRNRILSGTRVPTIVNVHSLNDVLISFFIQAQMTRREEAALYSMADLLIAQGRSGQLQKDLIERRFAHSNIAQLSILGDDIDDLRHDMVDTGRSDLQASSLLLNLFDPGQFLDLLNLFKRMGSLQLNYGSPVDLLEIISSIYPDALAMIAHC